MQGGFEKTRVNLVERPWAIDNLDEILERWKEKPHHKAMLFVDNAGTDVVLGKIKLLPGSGGESGVRGGSPGGGQAGR